MIFYKNTAGKEIHFDEPPFSVDVTELVGFEFTYNTNQYTNRNGGSVSNFSIGVIEKNISVGICADCQRIEKALEEILSITQYDVQHNLSGRFYIGDTYILCNLVGSAMGTFYDPDVEYAEKTYKLVISYPFWCREKTFEYLPADREAESAEFLDYPHDYPYDYLYDGNAAKLLENDHYADSDFLMIVYGPALNPRISIAGHIYGVTTTLYDGEYMAIDSRMNKVCKVTTAGTVINLFNYRNKPSSLFQKIPPGNNTVIFNQEFGFTITLFQERSEPKWSIS